MTATTASVLWLPPHLVSYRGLSGIDSALFGFIAQRLMELGRKLRNPRLMGLSSLLLIGFFMKCGYELATRQSAFASVDAALPFEPVPLVHVLGLLLGIGYASVTAPRDQNRPTTVLRPSNNHKFPHVEGHASSCPGPPSAFQRQSFRHDIGFMLQCHNERKRCFRITPVGQSSRFALSLPPPQPQWPILRQCVDPP
ncbi:MAG TPA: hypothetical protein PLV87_12955 [Opitutaceae bacterium]|nr:hypothetical protein [Opitutaceae bacterium]